MLRRAVIIAVTCSATVLSASAVSAGSRTSVYLVLPQTPTRSITVSGGGIALPAIARTDADGKTATGASLSYSTTGTGEKITVSIDTATGSGITLSVSASALSCTSPCSGTEGSTGGEQTLSTGGAAIITGIGPISGGSATADLTYKITTLSAVPAAEVTKTVTYTISA